jgi:hypothetical protein
MNEGRIEIRGPGGIEEQAGMPVSLRITKKSGTS